MHCMGLKFLRTIITVSCVFFTACSGGGGGGGSSNASGNTELASLNLAFSPIKLEETIGEGDTAPINVDATVNQLIANPVFVVITDVVGAITADVAVKKNTDTSYTVTLNTSPNLPLGLHAGVVEVKLCQDQLCISQYPNSPFYLPYEFKIVSNTNLTSLIKWTGVSDWETYQGNAGHTGYVPVTLNPNNFTPRWRWKAPIDSGTPSFEIYNGTVRTNSVAVTDNSVFITTAMQYNNKIYAINEADGTIKWQNPLLGEANPAAASNGKVFVATTNFSYTFMWSFATTDGVQLSQVPFSSQYATYYAPTIYGAAVFSPGGYFGGLNSFNFTDGSNNWFTEGTQFDGWTPAVDSQYLYYFDAWKGALGTGALKIVNKADGSLAFSILEPYRTYDPAYFPCSQIIETPVIGSNNSVISLDGKCTLNHLTSFNTAMRSTNWSLDGHFFSPTIANGTIYVMNRVTKQLEARNERDGSLQWSWKPSETYEIETCFAKNIVVTNNIVFVSMYQRVYAIEISSHQVVWKYWKPGELAISNNGILYIKSIDNNCNGNQRTSGALVAINLQ